MITVVVPVLFLMLVSTVKKIPLIGGNLIAAFIGTGVLSLVLGGVYDPLEWGRAWLTGLNQVAFIIFIVIFGSIFSALQVKSGAMDTVLNVLRAIFGHTPQGLVLSILIAMCLGGSLVGTVSAVGAVIGMLVVPAMDDMGIDPDLNCAIIVTGGSLGAIMPPISNAINVACSIIGIPTDHVLQISYLTVGIAFVLTSLFVCKVYIGRKYEMPQHLIPTEKASAILTILSLRSLVSPFSMLRYAVLDMPILSATSCWDNFRLFLRRMIFSLTVLLSIPVFIITSDKVILKFFRLPAKNIAK